MWKSIPHQKKVGLWWGKTETQKTQNKKGIQPIWLNPLLLGGAGGRNRTDTELHPRDFESENLIRRKFFLSEGFRLFYLKQSVTTTYILVEFL